MFKQIARIVAPVLLAGALLAGGTVAAEAAPITGNTAAVMATPLSGSIAVYINGTSDYVNAWNNGPYIGTYNQFSANDAFGLIVEGAGDVALQYQNTGGSYFAGYLGDCGNSETSARACVNSPGTYPWGANLIEYVCGGGYTAYWDVHWQGWLAPALPTQNGGAWYLNSGYEACMNYTPF